jgi:hypothetical protein
MKNLEKLISIIKESMSSSIPTNNISGGNIAKFDPMLHFNKKKNGKLDGRGVKKKYKDWIKYLKMI